MKKKIIGLFVCMLMIATTIPAVGALHISAIQNFPTSDTFQKLNSQQQALIFGKITNLNTYEESIVFQAVKIKVITFAPFSFNPYAAGEFFEILKEHKGFVGINFIFALATLHTLEITCNADSYIDRIMIISVSIKVKWRDIAITLDKPGATYQIFDSNHTALAPVNNTASAGAATVTYHDYIQLSTYTGPVTTTLRYLPTNTTVGSWTITV